MLNLTGQNLSPNHIITDFEQAIINACQISFPAGTVDGCYFHYSSALWRKTQELGLAGVYNQDPLVKGVIKRLMALGYIPIPFVRNCYNNVRNDPPTNQLIQTYPALQNYFVYFENTWLNANANFPPALWNVHNRPMDFRTNNHVESFNHKWVFTTRHCGHLFVY